MERKQTFYGSTTLGEKGQIVIPVEAREAMELSKGQKLLAMGMGSDVLMLAKPEVLERFSADMLSRAEAINRAIGDKND